MQIPSEATVGFNVLGYVSAGIGLGVTARNIILSLINRNFPVCVFDIDVGLSRSKQDHTFESIAVQSLAELPHAINLFILDIQGLWRFLSDHPESIDQRRFNAALVLWELPIIPSHWKAALECFDILLAPSEFIQNTFDSNLSHVPTMHCEHPLYLPDGIVASRKRFSIPEDKVVFVTSFDPHSDSERKNPFAAVEAFKRIAGNEPQAHMVIKVNDPSGQHLIVADLKNRCASYPGIQLLSEKLSYKDILALYASSDVFVSLHRSEGVGLGLMECMMLGKPVIATAWSGNTSFMDEDNSCLVSYELITANGSIDFYKKQFLGKTTHWANPNIDDAVVWMKRLVNDPSLRIAKGQLAAESIGRYQERARQVRFADRIVAELQQRSTRSKSSRVKDRATVLTRRGHLRFRTELQRLRERTQEELDRHLLWRFRNH